MKNYYVYYHYNSKNYDLIYIGVGYKNRAYIFKWGRNKHYLNYIKKYGDPPVDLKYKNLTMDEAYKLEEELINKYGRKGIDIGGILLNKSLGGKTSANGVKQNRTKEWGNKISEAKKNKPQHTKESKKLISEKNSKPVLQYDKQGNFIKEWKSQLEASKLLNINYQSINNCVKNISKTAGNFIWNIK